MTAIHYVRLQAELPELEDLEFAGNKLQIDVAASAGEEAYIDMWKQRLPNLKVRRCLLHHGLSFC